MPDLPKEGANRGNAGKGRPKGSPNKTTALLKDAILKAAERAGEKLDGTEDGNGLVAYLTDQAEKNPGPFMSLLGKVLPMQVTGDGGGPIEIRRVERVIVDPADRSVG